MPIYQYICNKCGHELDAIQKMSDKPLNECPKCKEMELQKKLSTCGFILKGGGWFKGGHSAGSGN